jgi:queuine tRNA-ribosyltransferase
MQNEILGAALLTEHNLVFVISLVSRARKAILQGRFAAFRREHTGAL